MWYRWCSVVPGSRRLVNSANHLLVWACTVNMDVVRETYQLYQYANVLSNGGGLR